MGTFANVVCKTVGIAGMSAVLYDACTVAKANTTRYSQAAEADRFEKIHAQTRTISKESALGNSMQKRVADIRTNNLFSPFMNNCKGWTIGFFRSLGENFVPVTLASIAIAAKGKFAKFGAWGLGGYGLLTFLKEGFGVSKKTSIE